MNKKILYKKFEDHISVNIDKLRPNKSYDNLISNRSYPIHTLVEKYKTIPKKYLKNRICPNCSHNKNNNIELEKDFLKLVKCEKCKLVYTDPLFNEEHYKEIYQSHEYQNIVKDLGESSHVYRKERFGTERIKNIIKYFKTKNISILDVGCSTGFFVEAAIEYGLNCIGIDLNPSAIEFGKKRKLDIYVKDIFDINDRTFDAITLFDVLEHLTNPSEIINKVHSLLNKDGITSIYVPNYDSASRILMGKDAHFIWPTHHLNYFNINTLSNFLEERNFEILEINTEGLDIFDYIWKEKNSSKNVESLIKISDQLQFFINAGGYGKNLRVIARKK